MSHRKAGKRRREPDGDGEFSPSFLPQTKRSKSVEDDGEMLERNVSALHTFQDTDTGVRRSSRPPKPKVFDDEETAVIGRTVEASSSSKPSDSGLIQSVDQPSTISKRITSKNEASIAKKQKKLTPTAIYDEGHKRETRRSYQSYLEELKTETDPFKHTRSELESGELTTSTKQRRNRERKVPQRRKSDSTSQLVERTTPKTTRVMEKTSKGKGSPHSRTNREAPDEPSPKVRTSSRTPVPKRIFSLLEEEEKAEQKSEEPGTPGFENEPVSLSSPKGRSTSKRHMPKNSFHLLAKEDRREMKQDVPEHTSSKTRSPKSQGSKRRLSTAAESPNDQNLSRSTPVTCDEPSPTVRVSSRGHKPKRTFSLLEGEEGSDKTEEGSNTVSKRIYEEERSVLIKQTEQQKSTVTKEPKRRKSNSGQQSSQKPSSKKELKSSSNHGGEKSDSAVVNVEGSGVDRDISAVVASLENTTAVVTPVSETSRSASSKDDQIKGRLNRRKGKPVKKKVATSQEAQMSIVGVPSVKVKIEPELSTGDETLISPKTITPKGSSKKKQTQALGKNVVKQEGVESTEGFSLSDIARGVIDTSTASNDLVTTGGSKGKRKGKLSNDMKQKPSKDNNKGLDKSKKASSNSDSKTEEHEHIILKLQLPQSDDSTKHKKHHHHHHHHHHHKRKHSSGSHEDGSPKKSHHKKSAAKLSDDSSDPHGNKTAAVGKKKKISIKFKGLLSKELEMESNDLDESSSTGLNSTEKQSKESGKKKKKPKKAISHGEEQLVPSSQSESEHVKLVIKKDKIPTDSKSEDVKTKKISKPTASSSANQKKTTLTTESKKKKGSSPPAKHIKSPQKPKIVTSYLLFCKQHRKQIVEENPGLEFTEISKKVGIAWNNLSEEDKEGWRQKAEEVKKSLGLSSPKPVINPKEEKAEAIDLAAHLQLLGESLCTVGACLRVQDPGEVHGSLSVLLDSALCAISPLLFLTSQIPEMNGCSVKTQTEVLDNLAYLMPGLG